MRHSRTLLAAARRRTADEGGFALIAALAILVVVTLLVGATVMAATNSTATTNLDNAQKSADEAAEAALRVALYRINQIDPSDTLCVNQSTAVSPSSNGWCQDGTETLGNGATFTYWDTPANPQPTSCAGNTIENSVSLDQRCVIATGTDDGVTRRTEARIAEFSATPLFPDAGLVGFTSISLNNQVKVNAGVETNGTLSMNNQAQVENTGSNGVFLGPSGGVTTANGATYPTPAHYNTPAQGPFVPASVNPGNSATSNSDYRITNGLKSTPVSPYDAATNTSKITWDATNRALILDNQSTLTLGGGLYNFCSLQIDNQAQLGVAPGVTAQIFIDSSKRTGSGCGSVPNNEGTAGLLNLNNGSFFNTSQNPTQLQIYVYDNSGGAINFDNQAAFYGTLYAPYSTINMNNQASINGGVAGAILNLDNQFTFNWLSQDSTLTAGTTGIYYRTAWEECSPPASGATNPQTGC